jgi:hypothetical protein
VANNYADVKTLFEGFLLDENEKKRQMAVSVLSKTCTAEELVRVLERYLEGGRYFYNVVCWLDRLLYAPEPMKRLYLSELNG